MNILADDAIDHADVRPQIRSPTPVVHTANQIQRRQQMLQSRSRQDEAGGDLRLGDQTVHVDGKRATLPDGTLAGSILSLDAACRNLVDFAACALPQAVQTVTLTPARLLGLDERKGHIAAGYDADLVLLTPDFQVAATFAGGRLLFQDEQENR